MAMRETQKDGRPAGRSRGRGAGARRARGGARDAEDAQAVPVSVLSHRSGVPVATIKYYIREGLLPAGTPVNARQSDYGTQHLERLRLIRGLMHVLGASIEQVRDVIDVINQPDQEPWEAMKFATEAIPAPHQHEESRVGKARVVLEQFGLPCSPEHPAVRHLDVALAFAEEIGMAMSSEQLAVYVEAARRTARADIERVPWQSREDSVRQAVLGTVVYEPVLLALRRIAHRELGMAHYEHHDGEQDPTPDSPPEE